MTQEISSRAPPVIALAIGDPAGIGPELTARLVADPDLREAARLIVVGDARVLRRGAEAAGVTVDVETRQTGDQIRAQEVRVQEVLTQDKPLLLDLGHLDPATIEPARPQQRGGAFALLNYRTAIQLAASGQAEAVCFTPFNKAAMRMAHPAYDDEIGYITEVLGLEKLPAKEFNILERIWNARVTSHVPLAKVASLITYDAVLEGIRLTHRSLVESGLARPRIAVAGLNPHAGDSGNFGTEEGAVIAPAIEAAKKDGIAVDGPFSPDTVFLRATRGQADAVLTMYHDQGQIAMKLLGFDKGVTLLGGFPFPICTPAHGSAYDIAGRGIANPGASREAVLLAARMVRAARLQRVA